MVTKKCRNMFLAAFVGILLSVMLIKIHVLSPSAFNHIKYEPPAHIGAYQILIKYKPEFYNWMDALMQNNNKFSTDSNPETILNKFKSLRRDPILVDVESTLRQLNAWEDEKVQTQYRLARWGTPQSSLKATAWLQEFITGLKDLQMRLNDPYFPFATAAQISNNGKGIHILNQAYNNIPFRADQNKFLLRGCMLLGRQEGGKTSAAFSIVSQIDLPILILDPKNSWKNRAAAINAINIPEDCLSFDLKHPENSNEGDYLASEMEGVALSTGLQYGLDCLNEACDIAIEQRRRYCDQPGENTPLCLHDIYDCLLLCSQNKSRRADYLSAARTAVGLLLGKGNLFSARRGLPLDELFQGRYVLPCQSLNTYQSRYLGFHLFNFQHHATRGKGETTRLKNLIVVDDSSKFLSRADSVFSSASKFGPWLHILSVLRSSGTGSLFIDQTVEPIFADIKQLCHSWLVVGGLQGKGNLDEVAAAMSLNQAQREMLCRLQVQECIAYCPTAHPGYPHPIHGYIPAVAQPTSEGS